MAALASWRDWLSDESIRDQGQKEEGGAVHCRSRVPLIPLARLDNAPNMGYISNTIPLTSCRDVADLDRLAAIIAVSSSSSITVMLQAISAESEED